MRVSFAILRNGTQNLGRVDPKTVIYCSECAASLDRDRGKKGRNAAMKRVAGGSVIGIVVLLLALFWTVPSGSTTLRSLTGVRLVTSGDADSCARLTSGKVDCWGMGESGQLGNGIFYTTGKPGSDVPVAVKGVGGVGSLGGVASLATNVDGDTYCALLISRKVDCWGDGGYGQLGNGTTYPSGKGSAIPVAVKGVGGVGSLGGVASLTSDGSTYCARLTSGEVNCWGMGESGQLGNGEYLTGSDLPVAVKRRDGVGTLSGVARITTDSDYGYCARLASGEVNCWGMGESGQLGNGEYLTGSDVPVAVKGVGGVGSLGDVASVTGGSGSGYCAVLTSGRADCWGMGESGQLGNGIFYATGKEGSALPVVVKGVRGAGNLSGVANLTSDGSAYCAVLVSGMVDCWGYGFDGELGNGVFYTSGDQGSALPVVVKNVGTIGALVGVTNLSPQDFGYCARLNSGKVDCWGYGFDGELGNGVFYTSDHYGSAVPVAVKGVGGAGSLGGVASLASNGDGYSARLTSGKVDCWGVGNDGQLGNGTFYITGDQGSAVPLAVVW